MNSEQNASSAWLKRVEDLINVLEGSSVGELKLTEGETEITIRRSPHMVLTAAPTVVEMRPGLLPANGMPGSHAPKVDTSMPIVAPLTGVYYSAASPTTPPFVNIGEIIHVGQVVALVEAMKVFNEINAEVSGRVTSLVAVNGNVVQKGDVLMRVEPL
jgi:acetyl-CoA carboxylase biotin carboxyl carrier protein